MIKTKLHRKEYQKKLNMKDIKLFTFISLIAYFLDDGENLLTYITCNIDMTNKTQNQRIKLQLIYSTNIKMKINIYAAPEILFISRYIPA